MLAADRGRESMGMAVGGSAGGGTGAISREGVGGVGGGLEGGARSRPQPQKQLRRKSVSFTADETYQVRTKAILIF